MSLGKNTTARWTLLNHRNIDVVMDLERSAETVEPRQLPEQPLQLLSRVYTICTFDRGLVVPNVRLIDAETDDEAVAFASDCSLSSVKEVWERHRLVAVIEPRKSGSRGAGPELTSVAGSPG